MLRSDNLIPLSGGAYQARAHIADFEICENVFPEINPETSDAPTPVTHYAKEGKRPLSAPPSAARGRGIFTLSNGNLLAAVGPNLFSIDANWKWTLVGGISNLLNPISIKDNGTTAVVVDGTPSGYTVDLTSNAFAPLIDPTGTFIGSARVDFSDTFLTFAAPNSNEWYVTLSNQVVFNALVIANKDTNPDNIVTHAMNIRQAWLLGVTSSEVWYLAGSSPFPYQEWPNIFIPYGCAALYSLVQADVDLFWISRNPQGQTIAVKTKGYAVEAISTRALEYEWSTYITTADVIGATFQQAGHTFIQFLFPTADRTWVYDLSTRQWHRRTTLDQSGVARRDSVAFYASVGSRGGFPPTIVGQDFNTGQIYAMDPNFYADNAAPIICRRTFPHVLKDMHEITSVSFVADFETGDIVGTGPTLHFVSGDPWSNGFSNGFGPLTNNFSNGFVPPKDPALCMRYSNDGGKTWSNYRPKLLNDSGRYRSMMRWRGLGMARDRVYELMWGYPGKSALQGAYLDVMEHSA